jgi:hypothetical protein
LTRRFSKWKFKKNVKGTERETILQVHGLAQARVQRTVSGVKITPAKRERWEKGLRKGVVQTTNLETTASSATSQVIIHTPKPSSLNNFNARVCSRVSPGATERPTSPTVSGSDTPELMGFHVRDTTHVGNEAGQPSDWKHNLSPNSAMEYSEPVIICGLFEALSLTPLEDITPSCQSMTTSVTKKTRRKDYLSNGDLFEMTHRSGGNYFSSSVRITVSSISADPAEKNRLNQDPTVGVFWSPHTKRFASPLSGELYPFPILDSATDSVPKKSVGARRLEELEWREKLSKLESIFPETNSSVLKAVEKLAYCEAKKMLDDVHEVILRVDKPGGFLIQESLQIMSMICVYFQNFGEAESILREVVQIRLIKLGPRHGNTLAAIQRLSLPISLSERYSDSEELLRIALEIGRNAPEASDLSKCRTTSSLANVLSFQGMHQESEALYRISVEYLEKFFGEDDPQTLRCNFRLARELRQNGLFRESERLLEIIARKQIERSGEYHPYTIAIMMALGDLLVEPMSMKRRNRG